MAGFLLNSNTSSRYWGPKCQLIIFTLNSTMRLFLHTFWETCNTCRFVLECLDNNKGHILKEGPIHFFTEILSWIKFWLLKTIEYVNLLLLWGFYNVYSIIVIGVPDIFQNQKGKKLKKEWKILWKYLKITIDAEFM